MYKSAGRPWPRLCEDDVIDYMVMEAVAIKVAKEDKEALERQRRDDWKRDTSNLNQFR